MKTLVEFKDAIMSNRVPHGTLPLELQALWLDRAGDWDGAHDLTNDIHGKNGAWIHAYLHRVEGDTWNAEYWYNRAGESLPSHLTIEQEWESLVVHFLK